MQCSRKRRRPTDVLFVAGGVSAALDEESRLAKKTKFRNPHQGYSRAAVRAHTSRALDATLECDVETPVEEFPPDSIARLMLGAEVTAVEAGTIAEATVMEASAPESGRMVAVHSAVTHVVRPEAAAVVAENSGRQRAIDRLLAMIRRGR